MKYRNRPLYPMPGRDCDWRACCDCRQKESWRMPLFDCVPPRPPMDCGCASHTVCLENPCCPGECAEVTLSVDNCGNLVICVHRDGWKNHRCRMPCK